MAELQELARLVREALAEASRGLVEREALVECITLAAVAGEHLLVIGPPGTAKSEAVRRVARAFAGRYFEYLLGRFTEPSEIFGPVDLRRLREGVVETETTGMLPEADIAFLDEVFLGSTAILNTLLALLNERTFRRGHTQREVPLRVCVGASNTVPADPALAAFADRFLLHVHVDAIPDPRLEELLEQGWLLQQPTRAAATRVELLDELARVALAADLSGIRPHLAQVVRLLRNAGIRLSDRRVVKLQRLVAAAAALGGRTVPTGADLWPVVNAIPGAEAQQLGREVLRELLAETENATLVAAAHEASAGPLARARRILEGCRSWIDAPRPTAEAEQAGWRLKLEGVAREIDAGFPRDRLPAELAELRSRIVRVLGEPGPGGGG